MNKLLTFANTKISLKNVNILVNLKNWIKMLSDNVDCISSVTKGLYK